jgi:Protein of unknown function (DUF3097)
MAYERDILDEPRKTATFTSVAAEIGLVVEDRVSGFCGDVVKTSIEAVTLRDRHGNHRHFRYKPGGFLLEGKAVTLVRPQTLSDRGLTLTASGSIAGVRKPAQVAKASRILVEGVHDAELVEHVWGADLREVGIVVERLDGLDRVAEVVREFDPGASRRLGILVDHLVPGSKESRLCAGFNSPYVLVTGTPFVDVWAAVQPSVMGLKAWPDIPRGVDWKTEMCRKLGVTTDTGAFWKLLRNRVKSYRDLRPELVGAVEQLIDFVTIEGYSPFLCGR